MEASVRSAKARLTVGPVEGASDPRTQMAPSSRWGRNSEPIAPLKSRKPGSERKHGEPQYEMGTADLCSMAQAATCAVADWVSQRMTRVFPLGGSLTEDRKLSEGREATQHGEEQRDPSRAKATVQAMGLNRRPSTDCKVKMGRYATMMMVMA